MKNKYKNNNYEKQYNDNKYNDNIKQNKDIKKYFIGCYYLFIHYCIGIFYISTILFCFNTNYLLILLVILCLNAISIIVLQDCPLTLLERKHLETSGYDIRSYFIKNIGIKYNCNHHYEYQLEIITNFASATIFKILSIFFLRSMKLNIIYE
jgi:hypothetical protein